MLIGVDIDGVLVDSPVKIVDYINERLPLNLSIKDIKSYFIEDALPEQYRWIVNVAFKDSDFWRTVDMVDGAAKTLEKLYNEGETFFFVTSSLPENVRKKIKHLSRNLTFFPAEYIEYNTINIQQKQLLKLDCLIDDALHNLTGKREYKSICIDMPYNQHSGNEPNFYRAKDWNEVYKHIQTIRSQMRESKNE